MGSVFDFVGDIVGDIIEFAVDDILEPIFDVVGDVVKGMGDDPLGTILSIASFVPGPHQVFVMVAKTALAVSRGDLIGAALNVAGYYAMPYVDAWIADTVGVSTVLDVGVGAGELIEIAAPTFTERVIAGAIKGLITPTISGLASGAELEDITKAAFIGAATSGGTTALTYTFGDNVDSSDYSDEELSVEYKEYKTTVDAIGEGISDLAEGFKDLPPVIQEMIKNTTASAVTAAISGGDVDLADILPAALAKAATKVFFTEGIIKDAYSTIEDPVKRRVFIDKLALLDRSLDAAITSGFAGADPVAVFNDVVLQDQLLESSKEIVKFLDSADISTLFENRDTASEALLKEEKGIKDEQDALSEERLAFDELTNDLEDSPLRKLHNGENDLAPFSLDIVKAKVERANELNDARVIKAKDPVISTTQRGDEEGGYFSSETVVEPGIGGYWEDTSGEEGDSTNWVSTGDVTSPMSAEQTTLIKEINTWVTENDRLLPVYKTKRGELEAAYAAYQTKVTALNTKIEEYNTGYLGDAITSADEAITLATNDIVSDWGAEVVVNNMNPDFNADYYAESQGILPENAHKHWLDTGRKNITSQKEHDTKLDQQIMSDVLGLVFEDQSSLTGKLTPENLEAFYEAVKSGVGYNLEADSESVVAAAKEHLSGLESRGTIASVSIDKGSVTDADIASGRAVAVANRLGDKLGISFVTAQVGAKTFDNKLNRWVVPIVDTVSGTVMYIDPDTEEPLKGFVGGEIQEDGSVQWSNNTISVVPLPPESFTVKDVFDFNPTVAIDIALSLGEGSEDLEGLDSFTSSLLRTVNNISELVKGSDSYTLKLAAGTALSAGGGLLEAFNGAVTFFRNERNKPIDARNTNLGKVSAAILDIAKATNPEEYNTAIKKFNTDVGAATGFAGTANAIWEGFKEAPLEVLVEFVGQELLQEIPLIIASGGTGLALKGAALASKLSVTLATKLGRGAAWGTNAGLQVLETAGSVAGETYAELYDEAIKMGVAPDKAAELAQKGAILNGSTAALVEGTLGRFFDVGDILSKKIAGSNDVLFEKALNNIVARGLGIAGEGISEGIEEAATTGFRIKLVEGINPAVTKKGGKYADWTGDLTTSFILGAVSGTGTSAGIVTSEVMLDATRGGTFTGADGVTPDSYNPPPTDSGSSTANALITFNPTISQAVKDAGSGNQDVSNKAKDTLKGLFNYDALSDTDTYENDFVYNTATEVLNTAFPDDYNTSEEVGGYYSEISADLGVSYDPSDSDIRQLTGSSTLLDTTEAITGVVSDNALTIPEIQQVGTDMGYTFSDGMDYGEIPGIGVGTPEEQAAAIASLQESIGANQFTKENLRNVFKDAPDLYSTFTPEQISDLGFVGQGDLGSDYNLTKTTAAEELYGSLGVTPEQVIAAMEAEGYYKPDPKSDPDGAAVYDKYVQDNIGTASTLDTTYQGTTLAGITKDTDARYIIKEEAKQGYLDLGVTNPTEADINRFVGLGSEDELSTNITSYLPVANYNSAQAARQAAQEAALAQQTQIATAIATQQAADEKRRQEAQQQQFMAALQQTAQTTVETPPGAEIGAPYDPFGDSIFANENSFDTLFDPKGAEPMPLAAAKGGLIMDPTDEILRILGGR